MFRALMATKANRYHSEITVWWSGNGKLPDERGFMRWGRKLRALIFLVAAFGTVTSAEAKPFRDAIPAVFHGTFASSKSGCTDPEGVDQFTIDSESVSYYEGNDFLLLGIEFQGALTKGRGSGQLFNGRFTSRSETTLLGEHNIRFEIDDGDPNTLHRYALDDQGEPIAAREVKSVRCPNR